MNTEDEARELNIGEYAETNSLHARIEELDFSVRTYNRLKKANILTIGELIRCSDKDLMGLRNFGRKCLNEVNEKLAAVRLSLQGLTPTGEDQTAKVEPASSWTEEQIKLFPDLELFSMTDEQLGLDLDLPEAEPLNPREKIFVLEYCANGMNGTAAARKAGYAHAHVAASRLLKRPRIQAAVAKELAALLEDGRLSREALLLKLRSIIHANLADLVKQSEHGGIEVKDLTELPPEISAAIKELTVNSTERSGVKGTVRESSVNIKLHEPLKAIELAAKILNYLGEKVDVTSGGKALAAGSTAIIYLPAVSRPEQDTEGESDG